jgi:hypothetical protein
MDIEKLKIAHNQAADVLEIEGIRYAGEIFRQFGGLLPVGRYFKLTAREDGVLTVFTPPPIDPELKAALEKAAQTGETIIEHAGKLVFINRGEQPEDTAHLDCPACGGSGHKDDARITAEDIKFLTWTKQHRPCHLRYYEDLQRRDAKKEEKS